MRFINAMLPLAIATSLAACQTVPAPAPEKPPLRFKTMKELTDAAFGKFYKPVPADDLLLVDLANGKRVTILLAPSFAPVHVANIKTFARNRFWDDTSIYRVHDGFVVQWGRNDLEGPLPDGVVQKPPAEYSVAIPKSAVTPLGYRDAYSEHPGFYDGFAVSYDEASGLATMAHCYGTVGAGRELAPDTGLGLELYAVIGHAPRFLEKNIAPVGRVIDGFEAMTALPRGTEDGLGLYKDKEMEVPIKTIRLASMLPEAERPAYEVADTASPYFADYLALRPTLANDFNTVAHHAVELCGLSVPTRRIEKK